MNKQAYKHAMNKIKWAGRQKGEKWGKKEMLIAQEMVMERLKRPTPSQESSGETTWQGSSEPTNLASVLDNMKILGKK